jgi:hypothetical protein
MKAPHAGVNHRGDELMMNRCPLWRTSWAMSIVVGLFVTLIAWLAHDAHGHAAASQSAITVHQGRLSVHLQDADVGDVLTVIGQHAGITILAEFRPGIRVSMHFSGMVLDEGLRHLLRRASLSSTMVYTRGPTGAVVLAAVHVFEEAAGPAPDRQIAAEPRAEGRREEAGESFADALAQLSSALPSPPTVMENDGAARFRALLESAPTDVPLPAAAAESELTRRFREALEQTR